MKTPRSVVSMGVLALSVVLVGTAGCKQSRGLPSAADGGNRTVSPNQAPSSTSSDKATGTDPTARPSGPSGGTTGSTNASNENRAGAGGGTTASKAPDTPPTRTSK